MAFKLIFLACFALCDASNRVERQSGINNPGSSAASHSSGQAGDDPNTSISLNNIANSDHYLQNQFAGNAFSTSSVSGSQWQIAASANNHAETSPLDPWTLLAVSANAQSAGQAVAGQISNSDHAYFGVEYYLPARGESSIQGQGTGLNLQSNATSSIVAAQRGKKVRNPALKVSGPTASGSSQAAGSVGEGSIDLFARVTAMYYPTTTTPYPGADTTRVPLNANGLLAEALSTNSVSGWSANVQSAAAVNGVSGIGSLAHPTADGSSYHNGDAFSGSANGNNYAISFVQDNIPAYGEGSATITGQGHAMHLGVGATANVTAFGDVVRAVQRRRTVLKKLQRTRTGNRENLETLRTLQRPAPKRVRVAQPFAARRVLTRRINGKTV